MSKFNKFCARIVFVFVLFVANILCSGCMNTFKATLDGLGNVMQGISKDFKKNAALIEDDIHED